jgi:hypothetical protein
MSDLSNLIYGGALSAPRQPERVAEAPAGRLDLPRQAGAAWRLAPLISVFALSLLLLVACAVAGHVPATHAPSPGLATSDTPSSRARTCATARTCWAVSARSGRRAHHHRAAQSGRYILCTVNTLPCRASSCAPFARIAPRRLRSEAWHERSTGYRA